MRRVNGWEMERVTVVCSLRRACASEEREKMGAWRRVAGGVLAVAMAVADGGTG